MTALHRIEAGGISVAVDLSVGHIAEMAVERDGRTTNPLHRAPWIDETDFPEGTPQNVRRLSGDFLCAPFGKNDIEPAPSHGWPANSAWSVSEDRRAGDRHTLRLALERPVFGARVEKILRLIDGHPFLYQEHVFTGGEGALSVAHHTMVRMAAGGTLAFSPKRFAETPEKPLEPDPARGRFALAYPARTEDLSRVPVATSGTTDLHVFPPAARHEDFLTLAEAEHEGPGWTIVTRSAERDVVMVLKNASDLPSTMLWMSNSGRDYAPWSGRHTGVLGIEDARASALGHSGSTEPNSLSEAGIPTCLRLKPDGGMSFRQVIGAAPLAAGETASALRFEPHVALLDLAGGATIALPFDTSFLVTPLIAA